MLASLLPTAAITPVLMLSPGLVLTAGLLGLFVGTVVFATIVRVPEGRSIRGLIDGCPRCARAPGLVERLPVLPWVLARGRCRHCAARLPGRRAVVEVATGLAFSLVTAWIVTAGPGPWALPAFLYLAAVGVALAIIDVDTHRLPDAIVLPSYVVGVILLAVASAASGDWPALGRAVACAGAAFGAYLALAVATPHGMGLGDVKLAGVVGLFLGWIGWSEAIVGAGAAFVLGGLFATAALVAGRVQRSASIPFGPWMLGGAVVGAVAGSAIIPPGLFGSA